jgi:hypothetical protein
VSTRNITLTLPAELVRRAKVIAATRDTSVSGLVAAAGSPTVPAPGVRAGVPTLPAFLRVCGRERIAHTWVKHLLRSAGRMDEYAEWKLVTYARFCPEFNWVPIPESA